MSRSTFNDARTKARLDKLADLYHVDYGTNGSSMQMILPAINRTMFNRLWHPKIHMIMLSLEQAIPFLSRLTGSGVVQASFQKQNVSGVILSQTLRFASDFYNLSFNTPVQLEVSLLSYSTKTLSKRWDFRRVDTGQLVCRCDRSTAYVGGHPIRALPFTEEAQKILAESGAVRSDPSRLQCLDSPPDAYTYELTVAASDMDALYHVNQAVYVRYWEDAAYEAGKAGRLPSFPPHMDVAEWRVEDISIVYKAECFAGDDLEVVVWESDINKIWFTIVRKLDRRMACYGFMTFHHISIKSNI